MIEEDARQIIRRRLEYLPEDADNWQTKIERKALLQLIGDGPAIRPGRFWRQLNRRMGWLEKRIGDRNLGWRSQDSLELDALKVLLVPFEAARAAGKVEVCEAPTLTS